MVEPVRLPKNLYPIDAEGAPKITIGGREWPVPTLAVKQLRLVIPGMLKLNPLLRRMQDVARDLSAKLKAQEAGGGEVATGDLQWIERLGITTEEFDAMSDVVFVALTRGTPGFARAEFDNMPVSLEEMLGALPTIAEQSKGLQREAQKPVGESPAGESTSI